MAEDWTQTPYIRVYVTMADDYPDVWRSDELLAWWLRLLVGADRYHPASAPVPIDAPDAILDSLESVGIIDRVSPTRYRLHGVAKLRASVSNRGTRGGQARAATASRNAGRFAGGPTLVADAGYTNGDAGSDAGENAGDVAGEDAGEEPAEPSTLVDAGETLVRQRQNQRTSHTTRHDTEEPKDSLRSSLGSSDSDSPPRAGGREVDDPTGPVSVSTRVTMVRNHGPDDAQCDEPELHPLHHRWYAGVGWRCLICEANDPRSFRQRVEEAGGDARPF